MWVWSRSRSRAWAAGVRWYRRPSVSTTGVNECVAAATRTCDPRSAAARTSAATSSSSRGAAAYAGVKDWLPGFPVKTSYLRTVSDPAYASVNGEDLLPDLAIGRLPAGSADEARRLVEKV